MCTNFKIALFLKPFFCIWNLTLNFSAFCLISKRTSFVSSICGQLRKTKYRRWQCAEDDRVKSIKNYKAVPIRFNSQLHFSSTRSRFLLLCIVQKSEVCKKDTANPRSLHKLASAYFFISIQHRAPTKSINCYYLSSKHSTGSFTVYGSLKYLTVVSQLCTKNLEVCTSNNCLHVVWFEFASNDCILKC